MASNSKAMLRHAGEPFFAWGDPLKLRRVYGTVDLRAKKCCSFVLKAQLELRAVMRYVGLLKKERKKERKKMNNLVLWLTSSLVPPRWFLATLKV